MRWNLKPEIEKEKIEKLANDLSVEKTISKILFQRDITTFDEAKKIFSPKSKRFT